MVGGYFSGKHLPSLKNVVIGAIGAIFLIQIISLIISALFPSVAVIKGGVAVLLMILAVGIMTLFVVGTNITQFDATKNKTTIIFVVIVLGLVAVAYWQLPILLPQIFSIEPGISQTIKNTVGSIMGGIF
jgi:hypothetical protein